MNLRYGRLPAAGRRPALHCCACRRLSPGAPAQDDALAVNHVIVDERLHTAGQPPAEQLATLGEQGFGMVINLAPPSSRGSIANEGELVAAGGANCVNIPVDWQKPTDADFALFSGVMSSAADRRVLVHYKGDAPPYMKFQIKGSVPFIATALARHGIESPFQAVSD